MAVLFFEQEALALVIGQYISCTFLVQGRELEYWLYYFVYRRTKLPAVRFLSTGL
jgi:hypothetical protein